VPIFVLLLIRLAITAVGFWITSWLLSGMEMSGGVFGYLWVAVLFGLVNAIIGTILRILTLPLTLVTLGLIAVVVNAVLLEITDALTSHLTIDEFFWTAIWASIILAVVVVVLEFVLALVLARRVDNARPALG
jgi:putative membrane protein